MRRFRILFVLVSLGVLLPSAFLVDRALRSVALERQTRHQALAERIFDEMERALSRLLEAEEQRPFADYVSAAPAGDPPLAARFQVEPGGEVNVLPSVHGSGFARPTTLQAALHGFWHTGPPPAPQQAQELAQHPGTTLELEYANGARPQATEQKAGKKAAAKQAVSTWDALSALNKSVERRAERLQKFEAAPRMKTGSRADSGSGYAAPEAVRDEAAAAPYFVAPPAGDVAYVELPPMTGRFLDSRHLMLYRTVVRETRGYRQGALLDVERLGHWLREQGLGTEGLGEYAVVVFSTPFAAASPPAADFAFQHRFGEPFADLTAQLALRALPGVGSTAYIYALAAIALGTSVLGLGALYRMVAVTVGFAERRANFVAAVSHELKTPLTAIRMYGEMLRDGMVPSEAKREEYYRHITVESERLSRLINNVLELSRLEKGTRDVTLAPGTVGPVLHEVAELLRPHVAAQGFELCVDSEPDLPAVRFERDALVQVLCNLVDNAVKYARDAANRRIELSARRDGGGVRLSVRDHGPGVAARHLGRIFEPFYRAENELTRRNKGTGIGLALVRGLAERMNARVSGRNAPGGGFAVDVWFGA